MIWQKHNDFITFNFFVVICSARLLTFQQLHYECAKPLHFLILHLPCSFLLYFDYRVSINFFWRTGPSIIQLIPILFVSRFPFVPGAFCDYVHCGRDHASRSLGLIHARPQQILGSGIRDSALAAVKSSDTQLALQSFSKLFLLLFMLQCLYLCFVTCKNNVKSGC